MDSQPSDYDLIRNILARYAIIVDDQEWEKLSEVFIDNAFVDFTFLGDAGKQRGILNITETIKKASRNTVSQHALTTQDIHLTGATSAEATTYITVIHVGTENHKFKGEIFYAWAKLVDKLNKGIFDGKIGWRISERIIKPQLPSSGNIELVTGDM